MSQEPKKLTFPFTLRDMFSFEQGATFALRIVAQSSQATSLLIRGLTADGAFIYRHITTNNSILSQQDFPLTDIPALISVTDGDQVLVQGDTYATLTLLVNGNPMYEFCSGLVYRQKSISYPTNSSADIRPGGGKIRVITGNNPAANAEIGDTVPAGQIWRLLAMGVTFVTDANVANRRPIVRITDGTNVLLETFGNDNLTAGVTWLLSWHRRGGSDTSSINARSMGNMPSNLMLGPGFVISTVTQNIQVGDNYGTPFYWVEQYFNPA